jgi:hypothetical protein
MKILKILEQYWYYENMQLISHVELRFRCVVDHVNPCCF